jgi:hypothetical protein
MLSCVLEHLGLLFFVLLLSLPIAAWFGIVILLGFSTIFLIARAASIAWVVCARLLSSKEAR